jgi:uncharacterized SAM-binding protein YcdF (DUF218 family)
VWLSRTCLCCAALILVAAGNDWLARWAAGRLERRYVLPAPVPAADAILIVNEPSGSREWPRRILARAAAGDRAASAFELFRQGKAPLLLCTGGKGESGERTVSEADDMRALMESFGVQHEKILVETNSQTTVECAVSSRPLIESKHIRRLFLVSNALHMPRVMGVFRRQYPSLDLIPAPAAYLYPDQPQGQMGALIEACWPSAEHLFRSEQVLHEYVRLLYCRARGQLAPW